MNKENFFAFIFILIPLIGFAQVKQESHYLLGMDINGYVSNIPFSKEKTQEFWDDYADFGRAEKTQEHLVYESIFKPEIYNQEVLIYAKIEGNENTSSLWMGIDPQQITDEFYKKLQAELKKYVYNFNVDIQKDAVQDKLSEAEQAAIFVSKEFEKLKREERRTSSQQERTVEKINRYEETLKKLRQDSVNYTAQLSTLNVKLDSIQSELQNIKKVVELYKQELKSIN